MGQREERLTTFMSSSVASALVKNPELFWDGLERPERMGQHGERLTTFMCGGVASKEGEYRVVYCTATFSTAGRNTNLLGTEGLGGFASFNLLPKADSVVAR